MFQRIKTIIICINWNDTSQLLFDFATASVALSSNADERFCHKI